MSTFDMLVNRGYGVPAEKIYAQAYASRRKEHSALLLQTVKDAVDQEHLRREFGDHSARWGWFFRNVFIGIVFLPRNRS